MEWSEILIYVGTTILAPALLFLIGKYTPNEKLESWGKKLGRSISSKASKSVFGKSAWESVEDKFIGGVLEFFNGVKSGMDSDDNENSVKKE